LTLAATINNLKPSLYKEALFGKKNFHIFYPGQYMVTQVTKGIKIIVQATYLDEQSQPDNEHYLFKYRITIENNSEQTVQLLRRHWHIFDSSGEYRQVEGEGVVGEKPVIMPADIYEYESVCNLVTEMGKMHGTYMMERKLDGMRFEVQIPEFELIVPFKLN